MKRTYTWFPLLGLVLAFIFVIVVLMPLEPSDFWTYLRIGDEIQHLEALPTTEFMTYTSGGQPAIYAYWLSALLMDWIFTAGGFTLTALITGLCVVSLYLWLGLCLKTIGLGPLSASLVVLVTALMASNNWSTRPQMFAFPLFGLALWLILRWQRGENHLLWLLIPVSALWVNLHGSYILLFVLLASALILGRGKRLVLLWVALAALAATLLNPYGFQQWLNAAGMIGSDLIKEFSFEWQPSVNQGWQMNLFYLSLLVIPLAAAYSKNKGSLLGWAWYIGFGWMALSAVRYGIWYSLIAVLLLADLALPRLQRYLDARPIFRQARANLVIGFVIALLPLACLPGIRQAWWPQAPAEVTETTPVRAVEWLSDHPEIPDPFWANWVASIYMTYALPERKVWITNRIEDFNEQLMLDNKSLTRASYDWQQILERYGVNTILLDLTHNAPLVEVVSASNAWREIYRDDRQVIYTR